MRSLGALLFVASLAHAEGIGLYAPTVPFSGPVARLDYVTALAEKLGGDLVGHAYAKAADFAAAVKRGELGYAVVDVAYLAAVGAPWTVLAVAQRGGQTEAPWEVVSAQPAASLVALRGRTAAVPAIGARDEAFLYQVLLEGELPHDFFAKVSFAPDALSAVAAVERGRADCAIVPAGLALPAGVHRAATLRAVSWPVLVALPGAQRSAAVAAAALRANGQVLEGFAPAGGAADQLQALAGRFGHTERRPPLLVPPLKVSTAPLVGGRTYSIPRADVLTSLVDPPDDRKHR